MKCCADWMKISKFLLDHRLNINIDAESLLSVTVQKLRENFVETGHTFLGHLQLEHWWSKPIRAAMMTGVFRPLVKNAAPCHLWIFQLGMTSLWLRRLYAHAGTRPQSVPWCYWLFSLNGTIIYKIDLTLFKISFWLSLGEIRCCRPGWGFLSHFPSHRHQTSDHSQLVREYIFILMVVIVVGSSLGLIHLILYCHHGCHTSTMGDKLTLHS